MTKALVKRWGRQIPTEAETRLASGRLMEAVNLPAFQYLET